LLTEGEKLALLEKLTDKEREVFFLAADGKKNGEIATILNSSEASVKVHRSRMTGKLGMKKPEDLKKLITTSASSVESKEEQVSLPKTDDDQDLFAKT
jgi:DNA-binding NarL/FixJ family response regulator